MTEFIVMARTDLEAADVEDERSDSGVYLMMEMAPVVTSIVVVTARKTIFVSMERK